MRVLQATPLGFQAPTDISAFTVIERLPGGTTTDFSAPEAAPARDSQPVDAAELRHLQPLLKACWRAFDAAVQAAGGKELRKGPRGGGRELEKIVQHVREADGGYLSRLGDKLEPVAAWLTLAALLFANALLHTTELSRPDVIRRA